MTVRSALGASRTRLAGELLLESLLLGILGGGLGLVLAIWGIEALRSLPAGEPAARNWRGPYLRKPVPLDPWGRPYLYMSPGEKNPNGYDLLTYGRDGRPGGEGEDGDVGA